ncbi:ShlB/FhaC/HecB family hemolysin secretion/activation protein [Salmonella enterica]|nr:ShlB/FhaC/HecB family hemolysin secretion/activation protein [Salmonella enterica]EIE7939023.1 ShlB/FhaC/HecB family hemolysin secretion/activation protein [Salmonella enterica]
MRYWLLQYRAIVVVFCLTGVCPDTQATAQNSLLKQHRADTLVTHQQRQEAFEQQLTPVVPDIHLSPPVSFSDRIIFPSESPCFPIVHVVLTGSDKLPHWLPLRRLADQVRGRCVGRQGINLLTGALQNRLVGQGYVTTRVLVPSQDLKSGTLRLVIVPGRVHQVRLTPDSDDYIRLYSSFPVHAGTLLDLRDIEQGLENLQRLPGVQADMEIVPGEQPGESDIVITRKQDKYWRLGVSLDDSGTRSTGRYLGGITFSLDNPFSLSDLLYVSATHNFPHYGGKGSKNYTGHYSVPFGYWLFSVTASDYDYHQTVAGAVEDYRYSGESQNLGGQLSRVLFRNGTQKTTLIYDVQARRSRNYINDTEIQVQRRQTAAWRLALQHRHYISQATLVAGISWQRGTRWFGAQPAPEETFGEATALSKILQMNASLDLPFSLVSQPFRYTLQYQRQQSDTPLTPQDQFAIGNRWTVRGFDGERTLNASNGWYIRNDLAWRTPLPEQELYLGVDYGEVGGAGSEFLVGRHLAGGVVGLRGRLFSTEYDFFVGRPFSKPAGFITSDVTAGFSLFWNG